MSEAGTGKEESKKALTLAELIKMILSGENSIEIEGSLAEKVLKIKSSGLVTWGLLLLLLVAVMRAPTIIAAFRAGAPAASTVSVAMSGFMRSNAVVSSIGIDATVFAITMVASAGGLSAIHALRKCYNVEKREGRIFLIKI